jgi:hypothetical protein
MILMPLMAPAVFGIVGFKTTLNNIAHAAFRVK